MSPPRYCMFLSGPYRVIYPHCPFLASVRYTEYISVACISRIRSDQLRHPDRAAEFKPPEKESFPLLPLSLPRAERNELVQPDEYIGVWKRRTTIETKADADSLYHLMSQHLMLVIRLTGRTMKQVVFSVWTLLFRQLSLAALFLWQVLMVLITAAWVREPVAGTATNLG